MNRYEALVAKDTSFGEPTKEGELFLHVSPNFLIQKTLKEQQEVLHRYGFGYNDPIKLPQEVREKLWRNVSTTPDGLFTFRPGKLYLGQTVEHIIVPENQTWRMRRYFKRKSTGETTPILTNFAAHLNPGSQGYQAFEIFNESDGPITIPIEDLTCMIDVLRLTSPASDLPSQFKTQGRTIRLGEI